MPFWLEKIFNFTESGRSSCLINITSLFVNQFGVFLPVSSVLIELVFELILWNRFGVFKLLFLQKGIMSVYASNYTVDHV